MHHPHNQFHRETKSALFQGKVIVVENLSPVLKPQERDKRKREIERLLYDVFSKYQGKHPRPQE